MQHQPKEIRHADQAVRCCTADAAVDVRLGLAHPPVGALMRSPAWVLQLQRTARAWGHRDFSWTETPDEYAESLADHIARVEVREAYGGA